MTMPEDEEPYPPDYFMDMDPEALQNDPEHECCFDTTAGDVEWVGEPDYGMGLVWECACGRTKTFLDEKLTDEYYANIDETDESRQEGSLPEFELRDDVHSMLVSAADAAPVVMATRAPPTYRLAKPEDFGAIKQLCDQTPELRVREDCPPFEDHELAWAIGDPEGIFAVAQAEDVVGFLYCTARNRERVFMQNTGCIVYIAVRADWRRRGVASGLYDFVVRAARARGVESLYIWADPGSGVIQLMEGLGFQKGEPCVWMDADIRQARRGA